MQRLQSGETPAKFCPELGRYSGSDQDTCGECKRCRVFVVDDERLIAHSLETILRMNGYDCRAFLRPHDALQAAQADPPDLLISDVIMPLLSGVDLAIELQKHCPTCKVLLFSGQAGVCDLLNAARANGHEFELLRKPMHPQHLLEKIHAVTRGGAPPQ